MLPNRKEIPYIRPLLFLTCIFLVVGCSSREQKNPEQTIQETEGPNIIFILADDLGYGDLGCYGQSRVPTPNIDRLAAEGMRFTQHYSGATVCAPSRSALMTGLHTGHTPIRGNKEARPEGQYPLPDSVTTLPEVLNAAGYVTGGFGKWGLGPPGSEGDPNNQGVDQFFGYNCQRLAHNYYPRHLWNNQDKVQLQENAGSNRGIFAPDMIHQHAMSFIDNNWDGPFFLYYPAVIPHAELVAPEPYMDRFRGKFLPEKEYNGYDEGPEYREGPYGSQPESHAAFAAMITHLDHRIGEIITKLETLGIAENTLIIFSSDNGPHLEGGADPDYFDSNGVFRGYKRDLYEGGIRVPMIARWPGTITAGTVTDHVSAFWDVMPTLIEITGAGKITGIDGLSFAPTLLGTGEQPQHDYLYWEFHENDGRRAVRKGDWKIVQYNVDLPESTTTELYNLQQDPSEMHDLSDEQPEIFEEMHQIMLSARTNSPVFEFAYEQY